MPVVRRDATEERGQRDVSKVRQQCEVRGEHVLCDRSPSPARAVGAREWDLVLYPFDWLGLNGRGSLDIRYVSRVGQAAAVGLGEKTLFPTSFAFERGGQDGRGGRTGVRVDDVVRCILTGHICQ